MERTFNNVWNEIHKEHCELLIDNWLDKYLDVILASSGTILDLGCGLGNDTYYLIEKGCPVLSTDLSDFALQYVNKNIKNSKTMQLDISKTFPFKDNSYNVIIADLSLHYFSNNTTIQIMNEIKRILSPKGTLIARVNSIQDHDYGAGKGKILEKNFYFINNYNKRFFDKNDIKKYFGIIGDAEFHEDIMTRYSTPKKLYEIFVINTKEQ